MMKTRWFSLFVSFFNMYYIGRYEHSDSLVKSSAILENLRPVSFPYDNTYKKGPYTVSGPQV